MQHTSAEKKKEQKKKGCCSGHIFHARRCRPSVLINVRTSSVWSEKWCYFNYEEWFAEIFVHVVLNSCFEFIFGIFSNGRDKNYNITQCGFSFLRLKTGVISGQYYRLSKQFIRIGYFHNSGFDNSIEEKISFSEILLDYGKISSYIFFISHFMKSYFSKVCWIQTFALNKIVHHWHVLKLQGRENSSSLKL